MVIEDIIKASGSIARKIFLCGIALGIIGYDACFQNYADNTAEMQAPQPRNIILDENPGNRVIEQYIIYPSEIKLESSFEDEYKLR